MTTVEQIKDRVTVRELFERDGIKLTQRSSHHVCLCPFHKEKTPSCGVYLDHFYCYGCNVSGDVFSYVMISRGCSFKEALKYLGGSPMEKFIFRPLAQLQKKPETLKPKIDWMSVLFQYEAFNKTKSLASFSELIGVTEESLKHLGCVWNSSAWAFPMRNEKTQVIGIRLRSEDGKKWAVKGSQQGLFIPVQVNIDRRRVFVCEGVTDTAACLSLGLYAIGRPSCNGCEDMVLTFLKLNKVLEAVIVADNDEPGIIGARKLRDRLTIKSRELISPSKDLRAYMQSGGSRTLIESMLNNQVPRIPK